MVCATYVAGELLGSPMALVDGAAGREGRTELRKATGFWIRALGERGAGATVWGWNCFTGGSVSGGTTGSLGLGRPCSLLPEKPPEALAGFAGMFSTWFVLGAAWGMLLKVPGEAAEGLWGASSGLGRP